VDDIDARLRHLAIELSGELDTQAHVALDEAARICTAHSLPGLLATIDEMRR
jgi:hypothetical protein